jgi:CubicO group peptidase (beta-lactamase class C family)
MRPLLPALLALALVAGCSSDQSPEAGPKVDLHEQNAVFSYALQELQEQGQFAGAVTLVVAPRGAIALEAFGLADIASKRPMRRDSVFWIASMTKPITSLGILMLVEEGKLGLDDPVGKFLPAFRDQTLTSSKGPTKPRRAVTVRDLLTHSSGLTSASPTPAGQAVDAISLAAMTDFYARQPLVTEPGATWAYSNAGMNTLGRIIEVVSGQAYGDFVQHRFLDPLGMDSTSFWPTAEMVGRMATPYRKDKDTGELVAVGNSRFSSPLNDRRRTPLPAGGLFSTAEDLTQLYQMLLRGGELDGRRYLQTETLRLMTTNQLGDLPKVSFAPGMHMGLGFHLVHSPQGVTESLSPGTYGHGGAYGTQAWLDPVRQRAYILLIQRTDLPNSDGSEIRRVFQQTAREFFGR